jgi:hypothetical protein
MTRVSANRRKRVAALSGLLLATVAVGGGCGGGSISYGPVPVKGEVTGKHQVPPRENPSRTPEKAAPRYFLWLNTKDGPAYVEVSEEVFRSVTEGDQVCLYCKAESP